MSVILTLKVMFVQNYKFLDRHFAI